MNPEGESWKAFRKAALKAHEILAEGLSGTPGAPVDEIERSQRIQTYRLLFMLAAGARGFLDIPDIKKSPRPFQQNILKWARENPPYMRRAFAYGELFEPARQTLLWRFKPSEESLRQAVDILIETDPSAWEPSWPGDLYPHLLQAGQRKESGAFYTPWPVVRFIVDQTLGPLCYADVDAMKPRDEREILSLKVLDPAVGGGRFVIAAVEYMAEALAATRGKPVSREHRRLAAERIYGVDRDTVAVDITRAGLWLHLGGPERPWDYLRTHFQVGDALIGATLDDMDREPPTLLDNPDQLTLFKSDAPKREVMPLRAVAEGGRLTPRLEAIADLWTAALLDQEKAREELPLVRMSLPHVSEERWAELEGKPGFQGARQLAREMKFFHWELRFPEVFPPAFAERHGFDAVIGNPPYRRERGGGSGAPARLAPLAKRWGEGKMDVLTLFIHRGLDMLKPGGRLSFITSSYWLKAEGASRLRKRLALDESFPLYVDLADYPIFEGLAGRHGIFVASRGVAHPHPCKVLRIRPDKTTEPDILDLLMSSLHDGFTEERFQDQRELLDDAGLFNLTDRAADLICRKMEERGVPLGELARASQGVVENPPELNERMIAAILERSPGLVEEEGYEAGEPVFLLPPNHHLVSALSVEERAFLRPYYRPATIRRYYLPECPDGYLIYLTTENCPDIGLYPWLREHLERYRVFTEERREVKEGRIGWWHLHWPREQSLFEGEHLLMPQMVDTPRFARANRPAYVGMSVQTIVPNEGVSAGFLLAVLNSRPVEFYLTDGGRAKERGIRLDISLQALRRIPIPAPGKGKSNSKKLDELMRLYKGWIAAVTKA